MATLTQVSLTTGATDSVDSPNYTSQAVMSGNTGAVTFTLTVGTGALVISPQGFIQTTGVLPDGVYTISGQAIDTLSNTGNWTFTLTVAETAAPQSAIAPVFPLPSTGIEVLVPFQIDPATGGVAYQVDYVKILGQHIESILMTVPLERVMLPSFGSVLSNAIFAPIGSAQNAALAADIQRAVRNWEPAVKIISVNVGTNPILGQTTLVVTVRFQVVPFTDVNTVTVTTGGTITQVQSP